MSECDSMVENCETLRARDEKAMGDVLAKENNEDISQQENSFSEDSLTSKYLRHDINGALESDSDELSPTDTPFTNFVEVRFSFFHRFRTVCLADSHAFTIFFSRLHLSLIFP